VKEKGRKGDMTGKRFVKGVICPQAPITRLIDYTNNSRKKGGKKAAEWQQKKGGELLEHKGKNGPILLPPLSDGLDNMHDTTVSPNEVNTLVLESFSLEKNGRKGL